MGQRSKIAPNSKTIIYDYDRLNRMTKKKYIGTTEEFNYTYKEDTRLLLAASGPSGTINYLYDGLNRVSDVVDQYYNTTRYEYDEGSRRKTMTVSKTYETCQYVYDSSNQLISIDNHGSFGFEYDAFGQMSKKTMANGTYTELQSDHLGRLTELINHKSNLSVISQYLSQNAGDFDLLGNRKKVSTYDGNYEYKYDSVYQLTESKVNSLVSEGYQYDSVGNRLVGAYRDTPSNNYVYDNNNRLTSITDSTANQITYTYDNNGSRITKTDSTGVTNYIYDYDNRLKRIAFADSTYAEYTYDALGRRIEKNVNGLKTRYCYDGEDIVAVLDSTNTAIASITHGPGIDHPLSYKNIATGQVYYYNQDYLGSITSITDSAQNVVETYKYDAFGNLLQTSALSLQLYYAYTGREYDPESGLYFYRARYYDSKVGRFLQADPIRFAGGLNFYIYVKNNPVNFIDSFGMLFERIWSNKNERGNHKDKTITMMKFIKYAEGKSLNHLQHDMDNGSKGQRSAGGPESDYRYVINPFNSDEVIDMRHFLVVGPQGELAGLEIELLQLLGDKNSAFDAQDFLSNEMGADFFSEYDPSKELSYQLQKYFYGVIEKCGK